MKRRRIFSVLTILLGLLIIAAGFATSILIREQLTNNLITQYNLQEKAMGEQVAETLALEVAQTKAKLDLIAKLPVVQSGDTAACNAALAEIVKDPQTKVGNLGRVGPDGTFRCSLNPKLIGVKAANLGPYITQIFDDPTHAAVMSRAILPPGSPSYVVAIHVPVWGTDGSFQGTLGGAIYLNDLAKQYLIKTPLAPGGYIALFDDDGTVLYHYRTELIGQNIASAAFQSLVVGGTPPQKTIHDIQSGVSGTRRYSFAGSEKVAAFVPAQIFPGRLWRVTVTVPVQSVRNSVSAVALNKIIIELPFFLSLITLVLLALFVWLMRREVFRPLEAVDKAKTEFVSLASHQLRTPLTAINWYTEMLLSGDAGALTAQQKKYLQEIYTGSQRMVELVNALLNVSRLDMGTFAMEPAAVNLEELAQSVIKEQMPQITKCNMKLHTSFEYGAPTITTDLKLVRMIFQNLLSNAVKYTPAEGSITLSITQGTLPETVLVTVADTGWGIPQAQQNKIFQKFFRADNVKEKDAEGTGLGLYLVKAILEKLGGSIRFESKENAGTTFYVTLPRTSRAKARRGGKALT